MNKEFKYVYRFTCTDCGIKQRLQVYGNKPLPPDLDEEYLLTGWQNIFISRWWPIETVVEHFCESVQQRLSGYEDFELSKTPNVPKDKLKKGFYYPIELVLSLL